MWRPIPSTPPKETATATAKKARSPEDEVSFLTDNGSTVMLRCPYLRTHAYPEAEMPNHIQECRQHHTDYLRSEGFAVKLHACKHNPEHELPRLELYIHQEYLCPERPKSCEMTPAKSAPAHVSSLFEEEKDNAVGGGGGVAVGVGPLDPAVLSAMEAKAAQIATRFAPSAPARKAAKADADADPMPETASSRYQKRKSLPDALGSEKRDRLGRVKTSKSAEEVSAKRLAEEVEELEIGSRANFKEKKVEIEVNEDYSDTDESELEPEVAGYDPRKRYAEDPALVYQYPPVNPLEGEIYCLMTPRPSEPKVEDDDDDDDGDDEEEPEEA